MIKNHFRFLPPLCCEVVVIVVEGFVDGVEAVETVEDNEVGEEAEEDADDGLLTAFVDDDDDDVVVLQKPQLKNERII